MEDGEYFDDMDPIDRTYMINEAVLAAHEGDALSAELHCKVQPLTLKRLNELLVERGWTMDKAVNLILKEYLYDAGY